MPLMRPGSLYAINYKCFGAEPVGFDEILPLNLIVGRNNSGKSALLDLVEIACEFKSPSAALHHDRKLPQFRIDAPLAEPALKAAFPDTTSGGPIRSGTHWDFGQQLMGKKVRALLGAPAYSFLEIENLSPEQAR